MYIKKIFRHIWPSMVKYKWIYLTTLFCYGTALVFDNILKTFFLKKIIDLISNNNGLDKALLADSMMHLVFLTALCLLIGYIFSRFATWGHNYSINRTCRDLYNYAFQKTTNHSYNFFSNHFTGGLVSKSKRFINGFKSAQHVIIINFWQTSITLIGVFIILFIEVPFIAFVLLAWVLVYSVIMYQFIKTKFAYDLRKAEADSRVGSRLSDVFMNIFALKVFSARHNEMDSFKKVTEDEAYHRGMSWYFSAKQKAIKAALMGGVQVIILYFAVKLWLTGDISTGTIVLIQSYVIALIIRLWELDESLGNFMEGISDMSEMVDIFEIKPDILDPKKPEVSRMKEGNITFNDVTFKYDSGQKVFKNFNLQIKQGERIGLVGHSGAGKSTITKLLLRFVDVTDGVIEIDGQNIKNVLQDDLRRAIAYVPQEPILFHRTIRENIAYGKPDATDEEVISAAKRAHAHEFIEKLQHGYDTLVGERGVKLSGGERQRVAIARVMLTSAPILILDEATSSLDSVSESYIQDAFAELMKGRTTIVIAHRLSTIQKMDRIIVLEDGAIKEEGTHKELLAKDGIYTNLWDHQTGGFLE